MGWDGCYPTVLLANVINKVYTTSGDFAYLYHIFHCDSMEQLLRYLAKTVNLILVSEERLGITRVGGSSSGDHECKYEITTLDISVYKAMPLYPG